MRHVGDASSARWHWLACVRSHLPLLCGAVTLLLALCLGGGTRSNFLSDAILQLATLPVLLLVTWRLLDRATTSASRRSVLFGAALVLVPLLQLIPVPPFLWTALPGRAPVADAAKAALGTPAWEPLTLTPGGTAQAALSLIPVFAIFGATLLMTLRDRRRMVVIAVAACLAEAMVGLLQITGGPESPLRFYTVTSVDAAVGLFANPNHFALALALAIAPVVAWSATSARDMAIRPARRTTETSPVAMMLLAAPAVLVLVLGVVASRSRAGLALSLLSLACALAATRWRPAGWSATRMLLMGVAVIVCGIVVIGILAPDPGAALVTRLLEGGGYGTRLTYALRTAAIAWDVLPFGTGVGSFIPVYALYEQPANMPANAFVNRAHCDWIELVLESGALGIALLTAFCVWFARTAIRLWRQPMPRGGAVSDVAVARVATIAVALVGLHSLVDYPLRTAGIAVLFAFACGCLFDPVQTGERVRGP